MHNPKNIITISQEEGSGGSEIARYLACKLKLRLVDENFIQAVYQKLAITDEDFENFDEKVRPRLSEFTATFKAGQDYLPGETFFSDRRGPGMVFHAVISEFVRNGYQKLVESLIREIAAQGKVVFLDLGANLVLQNLPQVLNFRIMASFEKRVERVALEQKLSRDAAAIFLREHDYRQEVYIRRFFGPTCANPALYHLVVNTTNISLPALTESLYKFIREYEAASREAFPPEAPCPSLADQESYTLDEAAHLLWVAPDVLRKAIRHGELKGKFFEHDRIELSRHALAHWMKEHHLHARFAAKV